MAHAFIFMHLSCESKRRAQAKSLMQFRHEPDFLRNPKMKC